MTNVDTGQVNHRAAEVYEEFFLPALFQQWPDRVADAAGIRPGQKVLDVACGTGVLARAVAERVGMAGSVVGLDVNEGMLAVARRKAPHIAWRQGRAEALPFDDAHFDSVVSQFGLMFFEDRRAALREMVRVLRPGGRLAVAVWDALENTPGYAAMVALLHRLFGEQVADALRAPYILGETQQLQALFSEADLVDVKIATQEGVARFPSIESWVHTDIKGWVLADMLNDSQFALLRQEAENALAPFVIGEGGVAFNAPAHIVSASKP